MEQTALTPSIEDVIVFFYNYWQISDKIIITAHTFIEKDIGICGDDVYELFAELEHTFNVDFNSHGGFRSNFNLSENKYLFTGEGTNIGTELLYVLIKLLMLSKVPFIQRAFTQKKPRDLTIGELHEVICKIKIK